MRVTVSLPQVSACAATSCTYNAEQHCHAPAITIGDSDHPMCDTYLPDSHHVSPSDTAGVGACKVHACTYNHDCTCSAPDIRVGIHAGHGDCTTFARRST